MKEKIKSVVLFLLITAFLLPCLSTSAFALINSVPLHGSDSLWYRSVWNFAYENPKYVSGPGTNIAKVGEYTGAESWDRMEEPIYYNLVENDYHKKNKDLLLEKAYLEFEENYEIWRDRENKPADSPGMTPEMYAAYQKVYSDDGVFKAWAEDYTNPEKTVYLEIMLTDAASAAEITADDSVALIYDTDACPCIVVRFIGNEETFRKIVNNANVLFVAPAFGARIEPNYSYREMRSPYDKTGITAASARSILRYAVGMDVTEDLEPDFDGYVADEKEFFTFSDLDFDGHITAADARIALRIAVGLARESVIDVDI